MFARTTTILAIPTTVDAGVVHVRDELLPALHRQHGFVGLSMLVDHDSGRCIVTTAWRGAGDASAAEPALRRVRTRTAAVLGGPPPEEEDWAIAVLHRERAAPRTACVRTTWVRIQPEQTEHVIDVYRLALLPRIRDYDGFCSASLLVAPESGFGVSTVGFASHEAMRRTHDLAAAVRERGARAASAEVIEVGEFDLALARLGVPELA